MAGWQSGHAADCKSVYAGSIPASASIDLTSIKKCIFFKYIYKYSFRWNIIHTQFFGRFL